ncbi:hypothetical protein [Actinoplanes sp. NPDC048796]|uniref:hypothetical protein n=1 Tax=unclassified Actinoplanes TaxID=2626549 RepID=UPI0033C3CFF8
MTNAQLARWQAQLSRTEVRLSGPCPECRATTIANLPRSAAVLEANAGPAAKQLTAVIECACDEPHRDRPDGVVPGCGRTWPVTATFDDAGTVTLRPAFEPGPVEAAEAFRKAQHGQLAALRAAGDKWTAGIAALIGLAGLILPLAGRDAIRSLLPWIQIAVGVLLALAFAAAAAAVLLAYRAAHGMPAVRPVGDDDALLDWYQAYRDRPRAAARHLRRAIQAALATVAALAVAVGLVVFGPAKPPTSEPVQITKPDGSVVCGVFLPSTADGRLRVRRADDGEVAALSPDDISRVKPVKACT